MADQGQAASLLGLPNELLQHILSYLEPVDLGRVAQTSRVFVAHSYDDQIWQPLVNRNLAEPIKAPTPLKSWRDLFVAHHPRWFLPHRRLWFSDNYPHGKLLLSRYDAQGGRVLAHTVSAVRGHHTLRFWEKDREVVIHSFNPRVSLDLAKPVVKLHIDSPATDDQPDHEPSDRAYAPTSRYSKEILMETTDTPGFYSSFSLCHELPRAAITNSTAVWPPMRFPATSRVRSESNDGFRSSGHRPTRLSDVSQTAFRVRRWAEFNGRRAASTLVNFSSLSGLAAALGPGGGPYFAAHLTSSTNGGMGIHMNEEVATFSTLPPEMYTPTPKKPWQGIWCGDYSGHGCEFLVVTQPDKGQESPLPEGMDWLRNWFRGGRRESTSSNSSYASAQEEIIGVDIRAEHYRRLEVERQLLRAQIDPKTVLGGFTEGQPSSSRVSEPVVEDDDEPSGRLEAIKLTGDPNIPRGHYTFIAPDIGPGGYLRTADEDTFRGARVVRSAGHIAGRGFSEDQYTPSQLIMVSHDTLAQFWEGFGHISYFQRVDIDALMKDGMVDCLQGWDGEEH